MIIQILLHQEVLCWPNTRGPNIHQTHLPLSTWTWPQSFLPRSLSIASWNSSQFLCWLQFRLFPKQPWESKCKPSCVTFLLNEPPCCDTETNILTFACLPPLLTSFCTIPFHSLLHCSKATSVFFQFLQQAKLSPLLASCTFYSLCLESSRLNFFKLLAFLCVCPLSLSLEAPS